MKHTKLPWTIGLDGHINGENRLVANCAGYVDTGEMSKTQAANKANAEFIVLAVNNHDALYQALKMFLDCDNGNYDGEAGEAREQAYKNAARVVSQADGKKPESEEL